MSVGKLTGEQGWRLSVDEELKKKKIVPPPAPTIPGTIQKPRLLTTAELLKHYGMPGDPDNMIIVTTPYSMRIAWDKTKTTNRILVHKKVAEPLLNVMNDLLEAYGLDKIQKQRIDLYGGLYNFRPMRGLEKKYADAIKAKKFDLAYTYLSRHSWASALDLDPERNGLKTKWANAQFSKPEYKKMNEIFYKHGFIGYGIERGNDAMHYEIGIIL